MKRIEPVKKPLRGAVVVPGDKSITHRAVMLASVAQGRSRIFNLSSGDDNSRTVRALRQLGVEIYRSADALCVDGRGWDGLRESREVLDCGNSGTTMRLMSGLLAGRPFHSKLDGDGSLRERPMQRIIDPLSLMGATIVSKKGNGLAPLEIFGDRLHGIRYLMPIASAQVKSAILLAGLQATGTTTVEEPCRSRDHTEVMLKGFGCRVRTEGNSVTLDGEQNLGARDVRIPGDLSSAAFFLVAAATVPGSDIMIRNVGCNPTRDGIIEILRRMGASIELMNERSEAGERVADIRVLGSVLRGVEVEPELAPRTIDEYPVLSIAAALADGVTTFLGVKELRFKESDRIAAMSEGLGRLGVKVDEFDDGMTILGGRGLRGGAVRSFGDHRVAMAFAVGALSGGGAIEIDDARCADISFPTFFDLM
ncbi:MAG: 3-phosphoshikimate 1-carboxyvinyltransferase, partial [Deltaproteobacteria bacterium]|nr:3-phosphoshikimate 1-carboxyvinyltransferase [Deltaproteobacteria bacterium]